MPETVDDIADRLDRIADRYANAGDARAEREARLAAQRARVARSLPEATEIEQAFYRAHPADASVRRADNPGCLFGWLGGRRGSYSSPARGWTSTSARRSYSSTYYDPDPFYSDQYAGFTLYQALRQQSPHAPDQQIRDHARRIAEQSGVSPDTPIGRLSESDRSSLTDTLRNDWSAAGSSETSASPTGGDYHAGADFGGGGGPSGGGDYSSGSDFGGGGGGSSDSAPSGADYSSGSDFGSSSSPSDNS